MNAASLPSSSPILVTGCSSGIGKATALRLHKAGHLVWASARKVASLQELKDAGIRCVALDLDDEATMKAAIATIEKESGPVEVLVNNAGYSQGGAMEAVPLAKLRAQFETNVFGLVRLTQLVLPGMRRRGRGRIINLSSMGGKLVFPGGGAYHATKHALEAVSDAMRFEVKGFGIDVVIVEPGLIKSGFAEAAVATGGDAGIDPDVAAVYAPFHEAVAKSTKEAYEKGPLAKLAGVPDDVAVVIEKAITAAKPKARYTVTGSAKLLLAQRRMLSDRSWDAFLRTSFPTPGQKAGKGSSAS